MKHPIDFSPDDKILVFCTDYTAYHIGLIRAGIESYFEQSSGCLSYVHLDMTELHGLFGDSLLNRLFVIGILRSTEANEYFLREKIPCLNLQEGPYDSTLGFNIRIQGEGREAARYFIEEMKLDNLAFLGNCQAAGHARRLKEFSGEAKALRNINVEVCNLIRQQVQRPFYYHLLNRTSDDHSAQVREFLRTVKKPVGIFCGDDRLALNIYFLSEVLGFSVPEEVAILGITSRSNEREAWSHTVSAVQLNHTSLGFEAARLMDLYATGESPPRSVRLDSSGIHHSQTTLRRQVSDKLVAKALVLIQARPEINVEELADQLKVTRRVLDARFQRAANMTAAKAIEIERFTLAKRLIRQKSYSLESIASLAGYPNRKVMRHSFYRFTRMGPQQFRELSGR